MSSNYWKSTQRKSWKFTRAQLEQARNQIQLNDSGSNSLHSWDPHLRIYIFNLAQALGQRLNVRQRVISTAHVYLLRLFTRIGFNEINIFLLVATAVYVACKAEELPQHILTVCNEARVLWSELMPSDASNIAECEFCMIAELESALVVYHPYRSLQMLHQSMSEWSSLLVLNADEYQGITAVINDSYASDIPLLYAPYIVATASVYITLVLRPQLLRGARGPDQIKARVEKLSAYLGKSSLDLEQVVECVQDLVSLYANWEGFMHRRVHMSVLKSLSDARE